MRARSPAGRSNWTFGPTPRGFGSGQPYPMALSTSTEHTAQAMGTIRQNVSRQGWVAFRKAVHCVLRRILLVKAIAIDCSQQQLKPALSWFSCGGKMELRRKLKRARGTAVRSLQAGTFLAQLTELPVRKLHCRAHEVDWTLGASSTDDAHYAQQSGAA